MKTVTKIVLALSVLAALAVGGFLLWFYVIKDDAPSRFDEGDLATAVSSGTGGTLADASGRWVLGEGSTVGYRVKEILAGLDTEGAGRTTQITGTLTIDGTTATAAEFTVDMTTFESDSDRRDGQFDGRIMSVAEFPTSTFVLTSPIDFGAIPGDGETITVSATGDLTLRGVTRSVTFDLRATAGADTIGVLGDIPVVFADYEIPNPSNGFAETEDDGLLEFVLVFNRA